MEEWALWKFAKGLFGFFLRHWKPLLLALLLTAYGWKMWSIGKEDADFKCAAAQAAQIQAAYEQGQKDAQAAADAALQARGRNDRILPTVRRDSQARIDRADTASAAERLSDDEAALSGYAAAADRLRGTGTR